MKAPHNIRLYFERNGFAVSTRLASAAYINSDPNDPSCTQLEPRAPINKKKAIFLNDSAQRNKKLFLEEEQRLQESAEQDSLLDFFRSERGYLYAYKMKASSELPLPKKGDLVRFQYQIEDLNQNIIYDKKSLGVVNYALDEEELLPALREGLRMMRPNEVVVFLI